MRVEHKSDWVRVLVLFPNDIDREVFVYQNKLSMQGVELVKNSGLMAWVKPEVWVIIEATASEEDRKAA